MSQIALGGDFWLQYLKGYHFSFLVSSFGVTFSDFTHCFSVFFTAETNEKSPFREIERFMVSENKKELAVLNIPLWNSFLIF